MLVRPDGVPSRYTHEHSAVRILVRPDGVPSLAPPTTQSFVLTGPFVGDEFALLLSLQEKRQRSVSDRTSYLRTSNP